MKYKKKNAAPASPPASPSVSPPPQKPVQDEMKPPAAGKSQAQTPEPVARSRPGKVYHFLTMGAATVVVLAGVKAASGIIAPMLLALFLTIILLVPLRWLTRIGCPNFIALIFVLGTTLMLFVGISYFVGQSANTLLDEVPAYKEKIMQRLETLEAQFEKLGIAVFQTATNETGQAAENGTLNEENAQALTFFQRLNRLLDAKSDEETAAPPAESEETQAEADTPDVAPSSETSTDTPPPVPEAAPESVSQNAPESTPDAEKSEPDAALGADTPLEPSPAADTDEKSAEKPTSRHLHETDDEYIHALLKEEEAHKPPLIALDPKSVLYWTTRSLQEVRNLAGYSFLVMIFTLFMIFEAARFPAKVDLAFGKEGPIGNIHFHHIANEIRRYLFLKAISSLMSATAATAVYFMFGVPATLFWGLVAFFLYFIPNIGGIVASIIPGLLIFMTYDVQGVLVYAVCLVAIECTIGYGIEPRILGHGLGISTVVILLSLFFWGWILGLVGFFLAAPLTIMVKIVLQAFKETEWIAILIGDKTTHPALEQEQQPGT